MDYVTATLEKGPYLLGEQFSAADILMGTTFAMFLEVRCAENRVAGRLCQAGHRTPGPCPRQGT